MNRGCFVRSSGFRQAACVVLCYATACSAACAVEWGTMKADRILFLGNSITYHPSLPSINWYGDWGHGGQFCRQGLRPRLDQ